MLIHYRNTWQNCRGMRIACAHLKKINKKPLTAWLWSAIVCEWCLRMPIECGSAGNFTNALWDKKTFRSGFASANQCRKIRLLSCNLIKSKKMNMTSKQIHAMQREEYWAQQRNSATTERALNYARRMEIRAAIAYADTCKKEKSKWQHMTNYCRPWSDTLTNTGKPKSSLIKLKPCSLERGPQISLRMH